MWALSVLAILVAVLGLIYMVRGGLDYPAYSTTSWFVSLAIILGLLLAVACLWNGWYVLTRGLSDRAVGPLPEPTWIGALVALSLAIAFGIVVVRVPGSGLGSAGVICPRGSACLVDYGNSRTELGIAAAAFALDTVLFGMVAIWASRGMGGED
jgi:hypothetical protein